jgi:hypothetical protein
MMGRMFVLLVGLFGLLVVAPAWGFPYDLYPAASLDELLDQPRPAGAVTKRGELLKLSVTLTAYGTPCDGSLVKSMVRVPDDAVDRFSVTRCITVRSAKGRSMQLFIQDRVAAYLPKEVPIGSAITLFAIYVYSSPEGPKILVNEFSAGADKKQ